MKIRQIISILAILFITAICVLPAAAEETAAVTPTQTPDFALMNFNRGELSLADGNYQQALDYFNQALNENTTNMALGDSLMFLYKDKSGVLTQLGRYDEAVAAANAGLALYPKSPGLWNNKGWAYYNMGKYSEALDAYENAVRIDPTYVTGWVNKGNALVKTGKGAEAVIAYNKVLELDPGNKAATEGLPGAKKLAEQNSLMTIVTLAVIAVIAVGIIFWYAKGRKSDDEKTAGKGKGNS